MNRRGGKRSKGTRKAETRKTETRKTECGMRTPMCIKLRLAESHPVSPWQHEVNAKALEIVNNLEARHVHVHTREELYKAMLCGARTYQEYADRYADWHETPELAKQAMDKVAYYAF